MTTTAHAIAPTSTLTEAACTQDSLDELARLVSIVAALPTPIRQALTLRFVYGFDHGEIAERLCMSQGAVESCLSLAALSAAEAIIDPLARTAK